MQDNDTTDKKTDNDKKTSYKKTLHEIGISICDKLSINNKLSNNKLLNNYTNKNRAICCICCCTDTKDIVDISNRGISVCVDCFTMLIKNKNKCSFLENLNISV